MIKISRIALWAILIKVLASIPGQAQNLTWSGGNGTNWSDPANWTPASAPVSGNGTGTLTFTTVGQGSINNDISGLTYGNSASFGNQQLFTFTSGNYTLTGNEITVNAGAYGYDQITNTLANTQTINLGFNVQNANGYIYAASSSAGTIVFGGLIRGAGGFDAGSGTIILSNATNTYGGMTVCNTFSTLQITKLSNGGSASSIGASSNATGNLIIEYGATLKYVGTGDSTDRLFSVLGNIENLESIDSSGSGALIFTNTGNYSTAGAGTGTVMNLTGTNTGNNTLSGKINDGAQAVAVQKSGVGTWILSGNNTYTGNTTITGGKLQIGSGGTTGALSSSSAITNNATLVFNRSNAIVQGTDFASVISGTGNVTQAGTGTLTLNGTNTFSGNTTIASGTLSTNNINTSATAAQGLGQGTVLDLGVASTSSGKLLYTGAAGTFAKSISVLGNGSDTIQNGGSGLLTLSGNITKNGTKLTLHGGSHGITVTGAIAGSSAGSDLIIDGGITTGEFFIPLNC